MLYLLVSLCPVWGPLVALIHCHPDHSWPRLSPAPSAAAPQSRASIKPTKLARELRSKTQPSTNAPSANLSPNHHHRRHLQAHRSISPRLSRSLQLERCSSTGTGQRTDDFCTKFGAQTRLVVIRWGNKTLATTSTERAAEGNSKGG